MSDAEACKPGVSMRRSVMPWIFFSINVTFFVVSASAVPDGAEPSPNKELITADLPTPLLPKSKMVQVKSKSASELSFSACCASATALSKDALLGSFCAPLPALSCSASSKR